MPVEIILEKVEKRFLQQNLPAVASLSLRLASGAVIGLVGPDGAGKSTLMRMLAGLLCPTSGTLSVAGFNPVHESDALHNHLGYMPQQFGLYEDLTVEENLDLYATLRGVTGKDKKDAFAYLLQFTALGPFTKRLAGKLSGGMKQKLGLACTLLGKPEVLLLDEPGVGVDPISRRELWSMVHSLADDGMLILWSTSYLDEAEQCREVVLLNEGQLLFWGNPKQLTETMKNRSFLLQREGTGNRALLRQVLSSPEISDGIIQGKYVRAIVQKGQSAAVFDELPPPTLTSIFPQIAMADGSLPALHVEATMPRFEDAFIDLLGGGPKETASVTLFDGRLDKPDEISSRGTMGNEAIIEAKQLTKQFGHFYATDHVNFSVKRGEIYGLLGPNGAGKSTTFKMMCGLLKPTSGEALVLGIDLKKHAAKARKRLGYMAQKFSLYGGLTVLQNLHFFSGVYGLHGANQKKRIAEMIDLFSFEPYLTQDTEILPLGFKQRLALACSLMHRPDILFLDEPTSGVDPLTRREFWLQINSMVEQGVTVMVTTHFMDEAEYCDRIGLVYKGKIIAQGSPDELKASVADFLQTSQEDTQDKRGSSAVCGNEAMFSPQESSHNITMEEAFIALIRQYDVLEDSKAHKL